VIERVWRGWTRPEQAEAYERLLEETILPEIAATVGDGYQGHRVLRRSTDGSVAFMTVLRFDSMESVRRLTGPDPETAHVPAEAKALLSEWEETVEHFEVRFASTE
jgi:heme-degrading monooxygenase HmoA